MTITTIRFTSCGDIHANLINLDKVKTFIIDMKNKGKVDFAGFLGDYVSTSSNGSQFAAVKSRFDALGIRYYAASGNHDASNSNCYTECSDTNTIHAGSCGFKTAFGYYPDQYPPITDFTKDGVTFQILIPGICWSGSVKWKYDFTNSNISKIRPTIVFNHGPVLRPATATCGAWDSLHEYAFSMKTILDKLNVLAVYSGHVHAASSQPANTNPVNGKLYVIQDAINSSRCSGAEDKHRNIGYTKIKYDSSDATYTIQYQNMEYMNVNGVVNTFVDPFPDNPPVLTSITLPTSDSVNVNGSIQLSAICKDQNSVIMTCPTLIWSSSDNTVATVNSSGLVTGVKKGIVNITVKSGSVVSNILTITVVPNPILGSIQILPTSGSINVNGNIKLSATCKDRNGINMTCPILTWNTSDATSATVSPNTGNITTVTGIAPGTANVTAKSESITSNVSVITVIPQVSGSITVTNPTTGIIYRRGESRVVRWKYSGDIGPSVKIELLKYNTMVKTLASSTANDGQMAWTVPNVTTGTDYRVKITSNKNAIFGISGKFSIK